MLLTLLVLASALFAGWYSTRRVDYFPERLKAVPGVCPVGVPMPAGWPIQDEALDEWFSIVLADFNELSLYHRPAAALRSVRFTLIPAVHGPVVVRVDTLRDGRLRLTAKQQPSGLANVEDESANAREVVRILHPAEAARLEGVLDRTRVLELPDSGCYPGLHGSQWLVEANGPSIGYRYRQARSPDRGIELEVGLALLELTNWPVEPILRDRPV